MDTKRMEWNSVELDLGGFNRHAIGAEFLLHQAAKPVHCTVAQFDAILLQALPALG